jgi:transposase InsO family protein
MSDNGPQMGAGTTREFLALCSIVAHFGWRGTPTDQAWIETLFGQVKGEWPHLEKIRDPAVLAGELEIARADDNGRRLHAGTGYVTPDDEHAGRGEQIRQARRDGLARARAARLAYHRNTNPGTQP